MEDYPCLPLLLLEPPYASPHRLWDVQRLRATRPKEASIFIVEVSHGPEAWSSAEQFVPELRSLFPAVPVTVRLVGPSSPDMLDLVRRAALLHVRAVLLEGDPIAEMLREAIAVPVQLGADVEEWWTLCGMPWTPHIAFVVREIFRQATQYEGVTALLGSIGVSERTTRQRFRKKRLPQPSLWFQAARALRAALAIQYKPNISVLQASRRLGYHDQSGLTRQISRCFGCKPREIQGTLGWEWLMSRWWERHGNRLLVRC